MSPKMKPLTFLAIVLVATGVLLAGLFFMTTITAETDFEVDEVIIDDQVPITITQTITQPPVTTYISPDQTTPPIAPPITTTQQITPYLKFTMTGTGYILDVGGNVLEEWQLNPYASVYEKAYGYKWKLKFNTRIESNIIDWSTFKLRHNIFMINLDPPVRLQSVSFNEMTSLSYLNGDTYYISKTYSGLMSRFSEVGVSTDPAIPSTVRMVVYNVIWHTDDIRGGYIKNRDFTDKAMIIAGFETKLFMYAGNAVVVSALDPWYPKDPDDFQYE